MNKIRKSTLLGKKHNYFVGTIYTKNGIDYEIIDEDEKNFKLEMLNPIIKWGGGITSCEYY